MFLTFVYLITLSLTSVCSLSTQNDKERRNSGIQFSTYLDKLRVNVLLNRSVLDFIPVTNNDQNIMLNIAITSDFKFIHLDVMTSTLTLRGMATFEWTDNNISWNPRNYNNISILHLSNHEIWKPELVLHNALDPSLSKFSESKISVDNHGKVTWRPKFDVKTKCNIDLKSWPWDRHKCTLILSSWSHKVSNIFYEIKENLDCGCSQMTGSDWKLDKMTSSYVEDSNLWVDMASPVNNNNDFENLKEISLQLVVEITRNTKILQNLFYLPLILISCLWLSSFCLMPYSSSKKITIICTSVILLTLVLGHMTMYVPVFSEFPPNLILGYLKLMLMISTDAFISSFFITIHSRKSTTGHPPFIITRFLTTPVVTMILVLPKLEHNPNFDFSQFKDNPQEERHIVTTLWDIVIVAFERIVFSVYFAITIIVLLSV